MTTRADTPVSTAFAGAVSLSVAMGIGRFAFTPLLPMMLNDGLVDIATGALLATMNYLGYLLGALLCFALPALRRRLGQPPLDGAVMVRGGLIGTVLLTGAMALQAPGLWPVLRLCSGILTAVVFVYTSGWCLSRLAAMGAPSLGGIIYAGPGFGIAGSGLAALAVARLGGSAQVGWIGFAGLSALLTASVWGVFRPAAREPATELADASAAPPARWTLETALFAFAYGLAGFGYIVTATFLPVIARESLDGSVWIDLFWPIFGVGVAGGALLTRKLPMSLDRRRLLIACFLIQAVGIAATVAMANVTGFILGSALVGLPFTAITLFGMQEARRLAGLHATGLMAVLTAVYGVGQILGPPLVGFVLAHSATHAIGFSISLAIAACTLLVGAAIFAVLSLRFPVV